MLTTDQKGNIAEAAVVAAAVKLGIDVYRPVGEGGRYDMILELGGELVRIQCKWAARHRDVLIVRCYSSRRIAGGKIVNRGYTIEEVDAFAVYSVDVDTCYLCRPPCGKVGGTFTLGSARRGTTRRRESIGQKTSNSPLH